MNFGFNNPSMSGGYRGSNGSLSAAPISANFGGTTVTPSFSHSMNSSQGSTFGAGASVSHNVTKNFSVGASFHSHGGNKVSSVGFKWKC